MRTATMLTAAALALAASAPSAFAQRNSGGGGTIGCDPSLPTWQVTATNCRIFHKEALYGPSANPYAAAWDHPPVVVHRRVVKPKKTIRSRTTVYGTGY